MHGQHGLNKLQLGGLTPKLFHQHPTVLATVEPSRDKGFSQSISISNGCGEGKQITVQR